jgi:uncharacterized repeat protein (TIGR04052 family)
MSAFLVAAAACASCSRWDLPVEIPFHAAWNANPIACSGTEPALTDLRFYVTNPRLLDEEGREHDVRFATEFEWENDAVALIDLETGSAACAAGSPEIYDRIIGVARAHQYRGLRFTVGVPFRLNHADLRSASPPLDRSDMHWQSIAGYRFLRAGVAAAGGAFEIHVGSAGCDGSVGYVTGCEFPSRIEVFLADFVPGESSVAVNLDTLLDGLALGGARRRCISTPQDATCAAAYDALGIDVSTGLPTGRQRVFSQRTGL